MRVADVMTLSVVTVRPSASVREVVRILLDHGISAVPVVDEQDRPVGIVSEGGLVRRVETGTETKRSWWLDLLATRKIARCASPRSTVTRQSR